MYDIKELKRTVDIVEFAARFTTLTDKTKQEKTGPCPICGGSDRFNVKAGWFLCRKCTDGQWRDVITLASLVWNLNTKDDFRELCERLQAPEIYCSVAPNNKNNTIPQPLVDDSPPSQEWQDRAAAVIDTCSQWLWEPVGEKARAYLASRGLDEFAMDWFKLGFCPGRSGYSGPFCPKGNPHSSPVWGPPMGGENTPPQQQAGREI